MKSSLHKLAGWIVLLAGLVWILGNIYVNIIALIISYYPINLYEIIFGGVIGSLLILVVFLFPGLFYLKVGSNKIQQNKLINASTILPLIGAALIILAAILEFVIFCPGTGCEIPGIVTLILGIIPAGFLYGLAVVLLIINWLIARRKG